MMKDRLQQIIRYYSMTATRFADAIQVQRSGISHILSGRNQPSFDFIVKVVDKFPEIDAEWLLTGKGKMLKANRESTSKPDLFSQEPVVRSEEQADYKPQDQKENKTKEVTYVTYMEKVVVLYHDGTFKAYGPHAEE